MSFPLLDRDYLLNLISHSDLQTIGRICSSHPKTRQMCINDPTIRGLILQRFEEHREQFENDYRWNQALETENKFIAQGPNPAGWPGGVDLYAELKYRIPYIYDSGNANDTRTIRRSYSYPSSLPSIILPSELDDWTSETFERGGETYNNQVLGMPTKDGDYWFFGCPHPEFPFLYYETNRASNSKDYPCVPKCGKRDHSQVLYKNCNPWTTIPPFQPPPPPVYERFATNSNSNPSSPKSK